MTTGHGWIAMTLDDETIKALRERFAVITSGEGFVEQALIMKSYVNEHPTAGGHNQPLATLGDAVIRLFVMNDLFMNGERDSGAMTKKAENFVKGTTLTEAARERSLEELVIWGKGDIKKAIWNEGGILGEILEALFGAAYLEGGIGACQAIYVKVLSRPVTRAVDSAQQDTDNTGA